SEGWAKVSVVGTGMQNAPGYAARMFRALADRSINIEMITTSEIRITCIIEQGRLSDAVAALHDAFRLDRAELERVREPAGPSEDPRPYWVGFNRVPGIGVGRLRRLIDAFGDARAAWEAPPGQLAASGLHGAALEALLAVRRKLDLGAEMRRLEERDV